MRMTAIHTHRHTQKSAYQILNVDIFFCVKEKGKIIHRNLNRLCLSVCFFFFAINFQIDFIFIHSKNRPPEMSMRASTDLQSNWLYQLAKLKLNYSKSKRIFFVARFKKPKQIPWCLGFDFHCKWENNTMTNEYIKR